MDALCARAVLTWRYEPPYDLYNGQATEEAVAEMTAGDYWALFDASAVVGFFCLGAAARVPGGDYVANSATCDLGLGMRPDLTGRGLGHALVADLQDLIPILRPGISHLRLTVAAFNQRAIRVYQSRGFAEHSQFSAQGRLWLIMTCEVRPEDGIRSRGT